MPAFPEFESRTAARLAVIAALCVLAIAYTGIVGLVRRVYRRVGALLSKSRVD